MVDLTDDLDLGPISVDGMEHRAEWFDRNVPLSFPRPNLVDVADKWDWLGSEDVRFLKAVEADADRLIWIAPQSATEQAGLHWYLDCFGGDGVQMIIADYPLRGGWNGEVPFGLGALGGEPMAELLDECPRVDWDATRFPVGRWQQLVAENALVRVVRDGVLQSVTDDFFDEFLLDACLDTWTKTYRVEAKAMGSIWDAGHHANHSLLIWRMRVLIQRGAIDCDGELPHAGMRSERPSRIRRSR